VVDINPLPLQLEILKGRELSAVTFVRDYLQLAFDGPVLTVISDGVLTKLGTSYRFSDAGFCECIRQTIGSAVTDTDLKLGEFCRVRFAANTIFEVSLRDEDYKSGPEALLLRMEDGSLFVW